jgi:hypothetical protein
MGEKVKWLFFCRWRQNANIKIFDILGKLVHSQLLPSNDSKATLDLSILNPGIYNAQVLNNNSLVQNQKFVVQK